MRLQSIQSLFTVNMMYTRTVDTSHRPPSDLLLENRLGYIWHLVCDVRAYVEIEYTARIELPQFLLDLAPNDIFCIAFECFSIRAAVVIKTH